jgi:hypothetical protein
MTVTNGYSSGSISFTGSNALKFSASNIINPRSLQPTGTFLFEVKSSVGDEIYTVTNPTLTIATAATFGSITITPTLGTNGVTTSYTWTFTTTSLLVAGDIFIITPPSTVSFGSTPTCTGVTGLTSSLT